MRVYKDAQKYFVKNKSYIIKKARQFGLFIFAYLQISQSCSSSYQMSFIDTDYLVAFQKPASLQDKVLKKYPSWLTMM